MPKRRTEHCWPVITGPADWEDVMLDPASTEVGSSHRIERLMTEQTHRQFVLEQAKRFKAAGWTVLYAVHSYRRSVDVVQGLIDDALAAGVEPVVFQEDPLMRDRDKARCAEYASEDFCFPGQSIDELYEDAGFVVSAAKDLQGKVDKALEQLSSSSEEPVKLLLINEARLPRKSDHRAPGTPARIALSPPVRVIESAKCPYCDAELGIQFDSFGGRLFYMCSRHSKHRREGHPDRYTATATINVKDGGEKRSLASKKREQKSWTQAESDKAAELREQGLSYLAIGNELGRTRNSVQRHLRRGGYEGTKQRQATRAYLRERMAAMTDLAI